MKYPKLDYNEEANAFSITFRPGPGAGSKDIGEGIIATYDDRDRLLMIELVGDVAKDYPELVTTLRKKSPNPPSLLTRS